MNCGAFQVVGVKTPQICWGCGEIIRVGENVIETRVRAYELEGSTINPLASMQVVRFHSKDCISVGFARNHIKDLQLTAIDTGIRESGDVVARVLNRQGKRSKHADW